MARVQFINAIMTGKLGGSVYARNKGGAYARTYVKPTNPNTSAQAATRSMFSNSSKSWGTITAAQQGAWNGYALTYFRPKKTKSGVIYSGFNAYASLYNAFMQGKRLKRITTITAPAGITVTIATNAPPTNAPNSIYGGGIQTSTGLPIALSLGNCTLTAAGIFSAVIGFSEGTGVVAPIWLDKTSGRKTGLIFFGNIAGSKSPKDVNCIGSTGPVSTTAGTWTNLTQITMGFATTDINLTGRKLWYTTGNKMIVTGYALSDTGEYAFIGTAELTVT